jgi:hypothetical protein
VNGKDIVQKTKLSPAQNHHISNEKRLKSLYNKRFKIVSLPDDIYRSTVLGSQPGINIFRIKDDEIKTLNRMNKRNYPKGK